MKKRSIFALFLSLMLFATTIPTALAAEPPVITADVAFLVDIQRELEDDIVLYDKAPHARRYPASLTKIMTALLVVEAVERGELQESTVLTCSESALADITWDASTQNIQAGEQMRVDDLLYCLMVASANEAGNILAEAISGSVADFVELMNTRAAELGMEGTHFMNPHGLHHSNHYSTAYDLYLLTRTAMDNQLFQKVVAADAYTVPATNMAGERSLINTNALLSARTYSGYVYEPATGVKTGYTGEAGYCLVSSAWYEGRMLICVVLGADIVKNEKGVVTDRMQFTESRSLLRYGFTGFKVQALIKPGTLVSEVPVARGKNVSYVLAGPAESIDVLLPTNFNANDVEMEVTLLKETVNAPIKQGEVLGSAAVSYMGVSYGTCDLVAISDVELSIAKFITGTLSDIFGNIFVQLGLIILAIYLVLRYIRTSQRKPRRGNQDPPLNTTPYPKKPDDYGRGGSRRRNR